MLTISGETAVEGRINVNQAWEHVLNTIPKLSLAKARAISRLQPSPEEATGYGYDSIAWLVRSARTVSEPSAVEISSSCDGYSSGTAGSDAKLLTATTDGADGLVGADVAR